MSLDTDEGEVSETGDSGVGMSDVATIFPFPLSLPSSFSFSEEGGDKVTLGESFEGDDGEGAIARGDFN